MLNNVQILISKSRKRRLSFEMEIRLSCQLRMENFETNVDKETEFLEQSDNSLN